MRVSPNMPSDNVTETTRCQASLDDPISPSLSSSHSTFTQAVVPIAPGAAIVQPSSLIQLLLPSVSSSAALASASFYSPQYPLPSTSSTSSHPMCLSSSGTNSAVYATTSPMMPLLHRPFLSQHHHHAPNANDPFASLSLILDEALSICEDMESIGVLQPSEMTPGYYAHNGTDETDDTNHDDISNVEDDIFHINTWNGRAKQ